MVFDTILIGAGPCAVAALSALPKGRKILVISGAGGRLSAAHARFVHAKIDSVARENGEDPGIAQRIKFAPPAKGELVRPAIVGGLANYWGQQFARYEAKDPWPRQTFGTHVQYLAACEEVEKLFYCSPDAARSSAVTLDSGYSYRTPNLVLGSASDRSLGLLSMRNVFQSLAASHGATVVHLSAVRWELMRDSVRVFMSDGSCAEGRQLLLAAGVVGTLNLAFASCPEIAAATFGDHAPIMLFTTLKKSSLPTTRPDGVKHFNTLAIEKILDDKIALFASLYRLSHAPLSLLFAMLKLPALSKGIKMPGLINLLTPIQLWTEATQFRYRLERGSNSAFVDVPPAPGAEDAELAAFLRWLKPRAKVWKISWATPGGGFHFCAARLRLADGVEIPLSDHLHQTQPGRVIVVDGASLAELGCRPSALTMMANSRQTVEHCQQS